ncbi:MAG: protein kinase [Verrucomicrobiales bacterium]|nr:protein kinase [Verrucomicrobiales bacterium]
MSNRYEIREQIGKGGLGAVYKAFDTQLHREVAMKRVLSTEHATPEEVHAAADKLIAEAKTLSSLNHPNIVTVFDVGQDEKGGFVVMELLKGETLDETVSRGVLTQSDFIEIVFQTMEALIAAQASNVLHRDLKPTNVMLIWQPSGKFQTKILDFGLAKFSKSPSVQTMDQEDAVMGSIYFMAPEQFERAELDARTDLYQMGCVYYHALTGMYPFRGETAPQVMNAHLQHRVTPLDKLRPDLSPSICQWVMWLINCDMANRPADARVALERFPRNPEPPDAIPVLQAIPVEESPTGATTGVQIVVPARPASAPPRLVTKATTGTPAAGKGRTASNPVAARGGGGKTHTGAIPKKQATGAVRRGATSPIGGADDGTPNRKPLYIVVGSLLAVAGIAVGLMAMQNARENAARQRLAALAAEESPAGTVDDVQLALEYLESKEATAEDKSHAGDLLGKLTGPGIDAAIVEALSTSPTPYVRLRLAQAAGERELASATPAMLSAFRAAPSDSQKVEILNAVRRVASRETMPALLDALKGEVSPPNRSLFEDVVIAVYRRAPRDSQAIAELMGRLASTADGERRSLFRILGAIGGDDVMKRLQSIYGNDAEKALRYDAVNALMSWPDRAALPLVEQILTQSDDNALKIAAGRAYARLVSLPAALPLADKVAGWKRGFEIIARPQDSRRMFAAIAEHPAPETKALLQEQVANPANASYAKQYLAQVDKALASAPELASGTALTGSQALIAGDDAQGAFATPDGLLTGWRSPETWFVWHFKPKEAGNYRIEISQSYPHEGDSEFVVILGDQSLPGKATTTDSGTTFVPLALSGTLALEAGQVQTLILAARGVTQPRMMSIASIKLTKQ